MNGNTLPNTAVESLIVSGDDGEQMLGLQIQGEENSPPAYAENLYRLYLIVANQARITFETQVKELNRHQLLTLSPGERVDFDGNVSVLSCAFHHNFFCVRVKRDEVFCDGVVFNRLQGLPVVDFPASEVDLVKHRFQELASIVKANSTFKHELAISALRSLLLQAADCKLRFSNIDDPVQPGQARVSDLVSRFQDLVEENFTKHLEVAEYCDMLGVTVATLNRHVKNELGQTAKQIALERLAIEARVALRTGKRSIKDVAIELGFEDPLYFSRFFRKQFGAAPTQYFSSNDRALRSGR